MPLRHEVGLVDSACLPIYDLGVDHPFARERQLPLRDLITTMELASPGEFLRPPSASRADLETAHAPAYIDLVESTSTPDPDADALADAFRFGLGTGDNPIAPGQHEAASAVAGATAYCVEKVVRGELRRAFNPTGGLHHAGHSRASGFCIYNDLVVGIRRALAMDMKKVLYVDFDVHHGDGVEFAFESEEAVCTLSFHQSPDTLFPGTGRVTDTGRGAGEGTVVNMPLAPYTDDASWSHCISTVLGAVARSFAPDLILSQHGCDPHYEDPLAQLQVTTGPMGEAARLCRELAEELCEGRWVATGGGGYQPYRVIPRAWSMVWLELSEREIPERVDPAWIEAWQHASASPLPVSFRDPALDTDAAGAAAARQNEHQLAMLADLHGLKI